MNTPERDTCPSCGSDVVTGARFCRHCGASVAAEPSDVGAEPATESRTCPGCSASVSSTARYCRRCGSALTAEKELPAEPATPTLPPLQPRGASTGEMGAEPSAPAEVDAPSVAQGAHGSVRERLRRVKLPQHYVLLGAVVVAVIVCGGVLAVSQLGGNGQTDQAPAGSGAPDVGVGEDRAETERSAPEYGSGGEGAGGRSGSLPQASDAQLESEVRGLLLNFHSDIVERNFRHAWALLSKRKREQFLREDGYLKWRRAQASVGRHLEPEGIRVRIDDLDRSAGTARVEVTGMGWSKGGSICSEWSGLTWVKYEDGEWRYDPGYSTTARRERAWERRDEQLLGVGC
jgi:ribosomal protein L40E